MSISSISMSALSSSIETYWANRTKLDSQTGPKLPASGDSTASKMGLSSSDSRPVRSSRSHHTGPELAGPTPVHSGGPILIKHPVLASVRSSGKSPTSGGTGGLSDPVPGATPIGTRTSSDPGVFSTSRGTVVDPLKASLAAFATAQAEKSIEISA